MTPSTHTQSTTGFFAALGSFIMWGLLPIYWKQLLAVDPMEILCHRIIWSLVFIAIILTIRRSWDQTFTPMHSVRNVGILILSSLCIGCNWLLYIWAVNTGHVLETSLGYYINPLVNILLGFVFFGERLNRLQYVAIGLAFLGVLNSIVSYGELPWISLVLAVTFAFYGLLRKVAAVESLPGLFLETMVLAPVALAYLTYLQTSNASGFLIGNVTDDFLLVGAGIATAMPLIGFAFGARRLQLTTLGILQCSAPSIAFLLGVFLYKEPFTSSHLMTFALIWSGLAVYTTDSIRTIRKQRHLSKSQ